MRRLNLFHSCSFHHVRFCFVFIAVLGIVGSSCKDSTRTRYPVENHAGRKALVIGASYGIGRATADCLADRGAQVVYASRNRDLLESAVQNPHRPNCHAVVMDASNDDSIKAGIEEAVSVLGGHLDTVVYCPGYFGPDSYGSFERLFDSGDFDSGFDGSIQLHLKAMLKAFAYSRKHLMQSKNGPSFIALSSIAGSMGHPGAALYSIAKSGVDMAVRQLALEYAPLGLRVFSVAPGLIDTPAIDNLGPDKQRFLDQVGASHGMERPGQASEVAEVIAFLCSKRASFMTGSSPIYIDGGAILRSSLGDAIRPFTMEGVK